MAVPRVDVTVRNTTLGLERLERFRADSQSLAPEHQHLIAELIMHRLFTIVDSAIEDLACKLVAGGSYLNGTQPARLFTAKSMDGAKSAMLTHGRRRARKYLQWTSAGAIRDSTRQVLDGREPFIVYAQAHGYLLNEMRKVRNFLAHKSPEARQNYRDVVRAVYGANSRVSIQVFLTSRRRPVPKVDEYLATSKILISDLARG